MADPYMSQITCFACNFAPRGWALCAGQDLAINQYGALYSLIGISFGGDGHQKFMLPDLRGRSIIGAGDGPGLTPFRIGEAKGQETSILESGNLPSHIHSASLDKNNVSIQMKAKLAVSTTKGDTKSPTDNYLAKGQNTDLSGVNYNYSSAATDDAYLGGLTCEVESASLEPGAIQIEPTGDSRPFGIRNPYLAMNYCICLDGIFPPRS